MSSIGTVMEPLPQSICFPRVSAWNPSEQYFEVKVRFKGVPMGETNSMKDLGLFITTVGTIPIDKTMIGILFLKSLSSSFNTVVVNFKLNC